jgi:hypothetical protein
MSLAQTSRLRTGGRTHAEARASDPSPGQGGGVDR